MIQIQTAERSEGFRPVSNRTRIETLVKDLIQSKRHLVFGLYPTEQGLKQSSIFSLLKCILVFGLYPTEQGLKPGYGKDKTPSILLSFRPVSNRTRIETNLVWYYLKCWDCFRPVSNRTRIETLCADPIRNHSNRFSACILQRSLYETTKSHFAFFWRRYGLRHYLNENFINRIEEKISDPEIQMICWQSIPKMS